MLTPPRFQQTPESRPLADVQRALSQLVVELNAVPLINGRLVERVRLIGGVTTDVAHGLGRPLQGWIVARLAFDVSPSVVHEVAGTPDDALYLRLLAATTATLTLWVF
jgi:hypothetical protein